MKVVVWSIFDSGNGSYAKVAREFEGVENYSIGIDKENKNDHFINLNLADYSFLFGEDELFRTLDKLPKPDIILASPPCESWSVASAMAGGNACWKQETGDSLFHSQTPLSRFTVRDHKDYEGYQFAPGKSLATRVNGELCIFNTVRIIKKYKPKVYVIENPAYGRIWEYIYKVLGFEIKYKNLTFYNNYDDYPVKKPTIFGSNLKLDLLKEPIPNIVDFNKMNRQGGSYNERSNIPHSLVSDIFKEIINHTMNNNEVTTC